MQTGLYVTVAAQRAMQKRLDTIAHNVANASTAGFRAEEVKFETLYSVGGTDPISFATAGATYLSRAAGETVATGNQLDVAVEGDGWLSVSTPAGPVYTRDGRMTMTTTGDLRSLTGYPVLDSGGARFSSTRRVGRRRSRATASSRKMEGRLRLLVSFGSIPIRGCNATRIPASFRRCRRSRSQSSTGLASCRATLRNRTPTRLPRSPS